MHEVFVNYRKVDLRMIAAEVYGFLVGRFGSTSAPMDHASMGARWGCGPSWGSTTIRRRAASTPGR